MSEQIDSKVPQIRFKEFEGGWNGKTLGSVLRIENGFAFKSEYFCNAKTEVVVLTPGSVKIGGGFQDGKGHFYKSNADIPIKYKFELGDIFITMTDLTPTAQALGYPARVPDNGVIYLHNQRLGRLVNFDGNKDFLFQLLSTDRHHKIVVSTASGTTVKHSSAPKLLGIENYFPKIAEQTQIGNYFRELDGLIGLHQRKHDKLVTLKKAMLQKMFPQPGTTTPEIRFKGFEGDWALKRIDEIAPLQRGFDLPTTTVRRGPYPVVYSNGILRAHDEYKCVAPGVVTGRSGTIGKVTFVSENYWPHNTSLWVTNFFNNDPLFIYYFYVQFRLDRFNAGSTIPTLNRNDVHAVSTRIPCPAEQQKIGTYFRTLDTLITQHATQLQKLQQLKSACLEKMLV